MCSLASHTLHRKEGRDQTLPLSAKGVACETKAAFKLGWKTLADPLVPLAAENGNMMVAFH